MDFEFIQDQRFKELLLRDYQELIICFENKSIEGGYNAKAEQEAIFTQADTLEQLKINIVDAIKCHFDNKRPLPDFTLKFI